MLVKPAQMILYEKHVIECISFLHEIEWKNNGFLFTTPNIIHIELFKQSFGCYRPLIFLFVIGYIFSHIWSNKILIIYIKYVDSRPEYLYVPVLIK